MMWRRIDGVFAAPVVLAVVISLVSLTLSVKMYLENAAEQVRAEDAAALKQAGPRPSEWIADGGDTITIWWPVLSLVEFPHWSMRCRYATHMEALAFRAGQATEKKDKTPPKYGLKRFYGFEWPGRSGAWDVAPKKAKP